jgi:hypothetical protein
MKTKAIISKMLPKTTYTSQHTGREFSKRTIVVDVYETMSTMYKLALVAPFDDLIAQLDAYKVGDEVLIDYRVSSREWNVRWFTEATLYKIAPAIAPKEPAYEPAKVEPKKTEEDPDDLPFY